MKELMESDPAYKALVKVILDNPYIKRQKLVEKVNLPPEKLGKMLEVLGEKMIVLELASQADSSVESRVPKKAYLINPDLESDLRAIL
jgi:hypothetical protein